jgi:hypothetical protein
MALTFCPNDGTLLQRKTDPQCLHISFHVHRLAFFNVGEVHGSDHPHWAQEGASNSA